MRQVSRCTITVILEQEHFQSFPEHWQWNVQQTEISWKTVSHDWPVNGKTAVSVDCPRAWNSELTGLCRAQVTLTAVWWRSLSVCRQVWRSHAVPTLYTSTAVLKVILRFFFGSSVDIRPWASTRYCMPECHGTSSGSWMERWIICGVLFGRNQ